MRMLLHVCCGPCAAFPVRYLTSQGIDITGYFYNPNIHPYKEYKRRLETAGEFAGKAGLDLIIRDEYTLEDFLRGALTAENRCAMCYELRLRQTARYARENGFDCFSTTLLVSPFQKHELIRETAERIAGEEDSPFCYFDFRSGWNEGVGISKEMGLYRQPYCGCIFSEKERYYKPRKG